MILSFKPGGATSTILAAIIILTPYVTFGFFPSDLSPVYLFLLTGFVFFFFHDGKARILMLATVLGALLAFETALGNFSIAAVKFSATIFIAEILFMLGIGFRNFTSHSALLFISAAWFISGLATLIYPETFSFLLYRVGYTAGRGATGLCPEPSVFGLCSAFLYGAFEEIRYYPKRKGGRKILLSAFFSLCSVALSASIYAFGVGALIFLYYRPRLGMALGVVSLALGALFLREAFPQARITAVIQLLQENGLTGILSDPSIAYRFANFNIVLNSFSGSPTQVANALLSGITLLFFWHGAFALGLFAFILRYGLSLKALLLRAFNPVLLPIILMMLFVGPLAIPFLWLWLGLWEDRRLRPHSEHKLPLEVHRAELKPSTSIE